MPPDQNTPSGQQPLLSYPYSKLPEDQTPEPVLPISQVPVSQEASYTSQGNIIIKPTNPEPQPPDVPASPAPAAPTPLTYPYNPNPELAQPTAPMPPPPKPVPTDPSQFFQPAQAYPGYSGPSPPPPTQPVQQVNMQQPQPVAQPAASPYFQPTFPMPRPAAGPNFGQPIYQAASPPEEVQDYGPLIRLLLFAVGVIALLCLVVGLGYLAFHKNTAGAEDSSSSTQLRAASTPCYTTEIPAVQQNDPATSTADSCHIATTGFGGTDTYEISTYNVAGLTQATLQSKAQEQTQQLVSDNPGSKLTGQSSTSIAGSPAYSTSISNGSGGTATIIYAYHPGNNGNNLYVIDRFNNNGSSDLKDVTTHWKWQ